MENSKTISVSFKGKTAELQQLPNGKWVCTNIGEFTSLGSSVTWLDDCRVPTQSGEEFGKAVNDYGDKAGGQWQQGKQIRSVPPDAGRFPANLLVSDDVLNDGVERKSPKPYTRGSTDEQRLQVVGHKVGETSTHKGDSGSYSRYFDLDAWAKTLPFLIVPKASKREKNEGLEGMPKKLNVDADWAQMGSRTMPASNFHPTVKPLKLMSYLITLGSREGDVVLDPFLGSGTTACAAKALGRKYIGIEMSREYTEIARARVLHTEAPQSRLLPAE